MAEVYKADPIEIGPLIPLEQRDIGRAGPLQQHPTEQHMITYTLSDDQLNYIESGGTRFTLLSTVSAFLWSNALSCFFSGLTIKGDWSAAQYSAFRVAPIFAAILGVATVAWAIIEYKGSVRQKERIKRRSFEPGTPKTLQELRADDGNV